MMTRKYKVEGFYKLTVSGEWVAAEGEYEAERVVTASSSFIDDMFRSHGAYKAKVETITAIMPDPLFEFTELRPIYGALDLATARVRNATPASAKQARLEFEGAIAALNSAKKLLEEMVEKLQEPCWLCNQKWEIYDSGLCFECWAWADDEIRVGHMRMEATEEEIKAHREMYLHEVGEALS
jgi:hypothetical protein